MMSWSQDLAQLLHKVADHDGFGQKAGHAAFQGIAAVFIECVGGHGKNRNLCQCRVAQCADLPGGGITVHDRHLHIHQHQIIAARCGSAYLFHRHGTVFRRIDPEAVLAQDLLRDLTVQLVVLYQQDVPALEVGALFRQKLLRRIRLCLADGAYMG